MAPGDGSSIGGLSDGSSHGLCEESTVAVLKRSAGAAFDGCTYRSQQAAGRQRSLHC